MFLTAFATNAHSLVPFLQKERASHPALVSSVASLVRVIMQFLRNGSPRHDVSGG